MPWIWEGGEGKLLAPKATPTFSCVSNNRGRQVLNRQQRSVEIIQAG